MNNRIFVNSPILLSEFCRSKRTRRIVAAVSAFCMLTVGSSTAFARTELLGGNAILDKLTRVTQGATTADSVTFNSSAKVGILDWSTYNIGAGQSMTYNGAGTTFFNLVNGAAGKSQIDGMINGNGSVWVINPNGVAFGSESVVNVGGVFGVSAKALTDDCLEKLRTVDAMPEGGLTFKELAETDPADSGDVSVSKGAQFNGNDIDFTTGDWTPGKQVALVGKSVKVEEGAFLNAGKVNIAAAKSLVKVDSVGDGTVSLNINAFKDVGEDINVTFDVPSNPGQAPTGPVEAVGNLSVVSEGNILVKGAVKADGEIEFHAGEPVSTAVVNHKNISVASGKYLQGKSVKAEASGVVTIGGEGDSAEFAALDGLLEISAGQDINVVNATVKAGTFTVNESTGAVEIPTGHDAQNLTLTSGGKITVEGASRVGASKDVTFQKLTGTDPAVSGGDIAIKGGSKVAANGNLNVDANGAVSVDSATVVARDSLAITAAKGVAIDSGAALKSSGNLTVTANDGAIEIGKTAASTVAAGENNPAQASTVKLNATKFVNVGVGSKVLATKDVEVSAAGNVNMYGSVEAKGTASLKSTGVGKSVKVGNGTDAASVTGAKVALEGRLSVQVQDNSTVTATGADGVSMKGAGYVLVDKDATVKAASGEVTLTANEGNADVPAEQIEKAGVQVSGAVEGKSVTATAKKGSILVDANGSVKATEGVASLSATGAQEGQGVRINGEVTGKTGVTVGSGRDVEIAGAKAKVLVGDVDTTKPEETAAQDGVALAVTAARDALVTGGAKVASSGAADLTATDGKLTVNGASQVGAAKDLTATAGDALEVSGNSQVAAKGTAAVTGGKGVTVDGSSVESVGDLTVKATDGNVLVKVGRVGSDGAVSVTAEKGNVRIGEKDTADTSVITGESGVSMKAKGYIEQSVGAKAVSKNGDVGYEAEGNVNMYGSVKAKGAATLQATGADKSVKVGNGTDAATVTGAKVALEGGLSAQVQDGSTVTATGADGVSMKGAGYVLVDKGASVKAASGAVTLTANDNDVAVPAELISKAGVQVTGAVEGKSVTATAKKGSILVDANGSVKATDGVATLSATGAKDGQGVRINGEVTGKTGVTVGSGRDVEIAGAKAKVLSGEVSVADPTATAAQDGVSLSVTAANDVLVAGGAKVASSGSAGLTATAGDLTVNGGSQVGAAKDLTATAGGAVAVDSATVVARETLGVTAARGVSVDSGAAVKSSGDLTVTANAGAIEIGKTAAATVAAGENAHDPDPAVESTVTLGATKFVNVGVGSKVLATKDININAGGNVNMYGSVEAKGAATLQATGADKSVKVGNGTDAATVTGAKVALEGGLSAQVQDGSTVTATGADGVSMKGAGYVLVDKGASVKAASGAVTLTANDNDVAVPAELISKAGVQVSGAVEGKSVTATAKKGSILVDANGSAKATEGVASLSATGAQEGQGVRINGEVTGKTGVTVGSGRDVEIAGAKAKVLVGDVDTTKPEETAAQDGVSLSVTAANDMLVAGGAKVASSGSAGLTATAGDLTVNGGSQVGAAKDLTATAGDALEVSGNSQVAAKGTATVTGGKGVTVDGSSVESAGNLTVTATTGDLVAKGAAKLGTNGKLTAKALAGNLTAQDTAVLIAKDNVEMTAKNEVTVTGTAVVEARKAVSVKSTDAGAITIDTTEGVTAKNGAVTVENANGGVTVKNGKVSATGDVKFGTGTESDKRIAGAVEISDNALVEAGANAKVYATKSVKIGSDNKATDAAQVSATKAVEIVAGVGSTDRVTVQDKAKVESLSDNVSLTAGDSVYVMGEAKVVANQTVTVDSGASVVVEGDVLAKNGNAIFEADENMTVSANGTVKATAGNVGVTAKNAVTVTGTAVVEAGKAVTVKSTAAGDITVDTTKSVTANDGAVTIDNDDGAVMISKGTVTASTGVDVDATDAVTLNEGATVTATAGDVTVDTAGAVLVDNATVTGGKDVRVGGAVKPTTVTVQNGATVEAKGGEANVLASDEVKVLDTAKLTVQNDAKVKTDKGVTVEGDVLAKAGDVSIDAGTTATISDNGTVKATTGDVGVTAKNEVTVTGTAVVEAGKAVTVKSTDAGDITVDTTGSVAANDGAVTVDNDNGAVMIKNATVEAKGDAGSVGIDATAGVTIQKGSQNATVIASQNLTVDNTGSGDIAVGTDGDTEDASSLTASAGQVAVKNAAADVKVLGGAKVTAKTDVDIDAQGSVLADDSVAVKAETGKLTADAATGSITVADKADVDAKTTLGLAAGTFVKVTESAQVDADDAITVTANGGDVTVDASADVTSAKGVTITASKGVDVLDDATVTANGGDAVLTAQTEDVKVTGDIAASANVAVNANTTAEVSDNGTVKATAGNVSAVAQNAVTVKDTAKIEGDGVLLKGAAVTTIGSASVKSTGTGTGGNLLIKATDSDVSLGQGTTIAASRNLKVEAAENVNQDTDLTAGGTAYVKAGSGDVNMKVGTTTRTSGGNARFEAGQNMNIANVDVGEGGASFDGQSVAVSGSITAGGIGANLDGTFGTRENPAKLSVSELSISAKKGIFIENSKDVRVVSQSAATETFQVNDVQEDLSDGGKVPTDLSVSGPVDGLLAENGDVELKNQGDVTVAQSARIQAGSSVKADAEGNFTVDGDVEGSAVNVDAGSDIAVNGKVHSGGETALTAQGGITVAANATVDGSTVRAKAGGAFKIDGNVKAGGENNVEAGGDVTFGSSGVAEGSTVAVKAGGSITQSGASLSVQNGYLSQNSGVRAAVKASNTATLTAGGSVGGAVSGSQMQYIGVDAGRVSASAGSGNAVIAAANGKSLTVGEGGIRAPNGTAAVYTSKTISTPGNAVIEGRNVNVTAHDYQPGTVNIKVTDRLTANNIEGGMNPGIAIFTTKGGKSNPSIDNLPNNMLIFIDGRLAGGDMMMINKLGALEAFPVATPELKSEQGIFGNPVFLHDQLDVSNPLAVGAIDFLLENRAELTYGAEFPAEADMQIAINGLSPTTSYRFGQNGEEGSENGEKGTGNGEEGTAK